MTGQNVVITEFDDNMTETGVRLDQVNERGLTCEHSPWCAGSGWLQPSQPGRTAPCSPQTCPRT